MSRPGSAPHPGIVARQRRSAERLRLEVHGADGSLGHPYFAAFERRLRSYEDVASRADLVAAAALADIVYVGDFHALPACQRFAAELLGELAARVRGLALGVEFVYTRQQELLDRRQAGRISDAEFLRRTRYRREWGYAWAGYRALLDRARELGVPVYALDTWPRKGFAGLASRDEHAARRIAALLAGGVEDLRLLVLFGESHLAREHLPRRVKRRLKERGHERREMVVFQSPDRLYWRALGRESALPAVVRVDRATFAVLHASPLEKYEAYRQVLERWRDDAPEDAEVDLTPAVHHLVETLSRWIGIRAGRRRVRHRAGWTDDLEDAFPEVYGGAEALALLDPVLRDHGRSPDERDHARRLLEQRGALYDARANAMFVVRHSPGTTAGEAARFLRAALTGRLFIAADDFADDPAAAAYGAAYNEALARLAICLVDPAASAPPASGSAAAGRTASAFAPWLAAHRRFEATRRLRPPGELGSELGRSRPLRRAIADDVGARLGEALVARVRRGELGTRELRRLFTRPLGPAQAPRVVLRLLRSAAARELSRPSARRGRG